MLQCLFEDSDRQFEQKVSHLGPQPKLKLNLPIISRGFVTRVYICLEKTNLMVRVHAMRLNCELHLDLLSQNYNFSVLMVGV